MQCSGKISHKGFHTLPTDQFCHHFGVDKLEAFPGPFQHIFQKTERLIRAAALSVKKGKGIWSHKKPHANLLQWLSRLFPLFFKNSVNNFTHAVYRRDCFVRTKSTLFGHACLCSIYLMKFEFTKQKGCPNAQEAL